MPHVSRAHCLYDGICGTVSGLMMPHSIALGQFWMEFVMVAQFRWDANCLVHSSCVRMVSFCGRVTVVHRWYLPLIPADVRWGSSSEVGGPAA